MSLSEASRRASNYRPFLVFLRLPSPHRVDSKRARNRPPRTDRFSLDSGRLCVQLTRHREAGILVGRAGDGDLLEDEIPPLTPAYLGWDPDPVLDGWEVRARVFAALEPFRIRV